MNPDDNQQRLIGLRLELPEINQILEALGQLPFALVHELIGKIQQQASHQLGEDATGGQDTN